jgi:hypothetical protein
MALLVPAQQGTKECNSGQYVEIPGKLTAMRGGDELSHDNYKYKAERNCLQAFECSGDGIIVLELKLQWLFASVNCTQQWWE